MKSRFAAVAAAFLIEAARVGRAQPTDAARAPKLDYPQARRDESADVYFGTRVPDPYRWMEDLDSPGVKEWVDAENKVTFGYLDKIPVRQWIRKRLTGLWNYAKVSTPSEVKGGRIFFRKNSGLQNQFVLYVQDGASAAPRELLDPNSLSPDGSIALLSYQPAPRGDHVAYDLSQGGSDWTTIHVRNVATGKDLSDRLEWAKFSQEAWTADGKGFFYSRFPTPPQGKVISQQVTNHKLFYHRLGTPQSADRLIYARPDLPQWIINGDVTEDGRYLFIYLNNGSASENELFYADLGDPQKPNLGARIEPISTKNDAIYAAVGHDKDTVFVQTTSGAPKGRIVAVRLAEPDPARWRVVVPEGEGVLNGASMARGRLVLHYQVIAKSQVSIYTTDGKAQGTLALPTLGSVVGLSSRNDSTSVYYSFASFLYPTSVYRYDVQTGQTQTFFHPDVDFDPSAYETKQVFYPSKDGTRIPMFVTARKGITLDGSHPTILYGYGGFDITINPSFDPMLPVWLELGGVYAVANLRGGAEEGEAWHEAGKLGRKQNVFDDFAWAAKYLISEKFTSPRHLGIEGYSNGGLLVGASITQHPELFGSAYAGAGVMDMLRYQKFSGGDLWVPEYGSSEDRQGFQWLSAYSPLQNLKQGTCYPPIIITTADHDDRVVPSHSYKFAAELQHDQACDNPVLIRVETKTSHGYMPTDKRIAQTADVWAFQAFNLGIVEPPVASSPR
jgi:prolyl oligopeptidase